MAIDVFSEAHITDLSVDSATSRESFNIISQGEISKILSNSSSDRRVIIENAAGVLKYKKRKEEAIKKLDKTQNNMERVLDIINELDEYANALIMSLKPIDFMWKDGDHRRIRMGFSAQHTSRICKSRRRFTRRH